MEQAKDGQGIQAAKRAQTVLESVLNPPALQTDRADQRYSSLPRFITSNYCDVVLQAFAVCDGGPQAAEQAENLLRNTMIHHHPHPHCHSNNNDNEQQQRRRLMAPTLKSFNIVLMCWARSRAPAAGVRATQLIENIMMDEWNRQMVPAVSADDDREDRHALGGRGYRSSTGSTRGRTVGTPKHRSGRCPFSGKLCMPRTTMTATTSIAAAATLLLPTTPCFATCNWMSPSLMPPFTPGCAAIEVVQLPSRPRRFSIC